MHNYLTKFMEIKSRSDLMILNFSIFSITLTMLTNLKFSIGPSKLSSLLVDHIAYLKLIIKISK